MRELGVVNANAFEEKLEFVNGVVPEEALEASGEVGGGVGDVLDEIGEGEEGVVADVLGVGVGEGPGGVEVVGEDLLGLVESFGLVLGGDIGDFWEPFGGCGGRGEVVGEEVQQGFGEGHDLGACFFFFLINFWVL